MMKLRNYKLFGLGLCCFLSSILLPSPSTLVNEQQHPGGYYSLMAPQQTNGTLTITSTHDLESSKRTIAGEDYYSRNKGDDDSHSALDDGPGPNRNSNSHRHYSPRLPPPQCTEHQLSAIQQMLPDSQTIKWNTKCPDSTWIEDRSRNYNNGAATAAAKDLPILFEPNPNQRTPLSIFCGCNKAMDAVNTLRMFSLNPKIDKDVWSDAFRILDGSSCQQHLTPQFPISQQQQQQQTPRPAIVHCIEAMPSTFTVLERTVKQLKWQDSLKVHHAAMADSDGETLFPNAMVGTEHLGMDACTKKRWRKQCESVPQYQLDTFVQKFVEEKDPIIDFLSIDVEGFDWPVLLGATKTLQSTKYLEFEYHEVGAWKQYNLSTAILSLHQQGFVCYWAGRGGKLWRITDCWMDYYDFAKQWSNVACVNLALAPTLAMRMEGVFLKTLDHHSTSAAAN